MIGPYCRPGKCFVEYFADGAQPSVPPDYILMSGFPPADGRRYVAAGNGEWVPAESLLDMDALKKTVRDRIDLLRDEKLRSGFSWNGYLFDNDLVSLVRISGAYSLACQAKNSGDADWSKNWITADNTVVNLTADDMIAVGQAAADHEQSMIYAGQAHKTAVRALPTVHDVLAYDYLANW